MLSSSAMKALIDIINQAGAERDEKALRIAVLTMLKMQGTSMAALARSLGIQPGAARVVFARPYPRVEMAVAYRLGIKPQDLWPDRYDARGNPLRRRKKALFERHEFRVSSR